MRAKKNGFTLLEMLVVMVVIAILSGLGVTGYRMAQRQAKEGCAKADIERLRTALEEYRVEFGRYPQQGTSINIADLSDVGFLTNAVEDVVLVDPWGNGYRYQCSAPFLYRIWSEGQDNTVAEDDIDPSKAGY